MPSIHIPNEIYQAQEEGRLVLFCGAGISSMGAKLPVFWELVRDVYKDIFHGNLIEGSISDLADKLDSFGPIQKSFTLGQYDVDLVRKSGEHL